MINIDNKNYRIITQDDDGNLLIGYFVVKNKELLDKLCKILVQDRMYDYLMKDEFDDFFIRQKEDNFRISVKRCKCSNDEVLPKLEVNENCIIRRNNFKKEHIHTYYDEYMYEFVFLNSFLILSSLLGYIDDNNLGSNAKVFKNGGIIGEMSFSDAWRECSKKLLKDKNNSDMEFFREIFNSGIFIEYVITEVIQFDDLKDKNVLKKLDVMLSEIAHNSEILGTYNKRKNFSK